MTGKLTTIYMSVFITAMQSVLARDCEIVTEHNGNTTWSNYLIVSSENYTINATCKCAAGKPYWTGINKAHLQDPDENKEYTGTNPDYETEVELRDLKKFFVYESTHLLCGNNDKNYAPAIVIVITHNGSTDCPSSSSSIQPLPSPLYNSSQSIYTSSPVSNGIPVTSPSPSSSIHPLPSPLYNSSQTIYTSISTGTPVTNNVLSADKQTLMFRNAFIVVLSLTCVLLTTSVVLTILLIIVLIVYKVKRKTECPSNEIE